MLGFSTYSYDSTIRIISVGPKSDNTRCASILVPGTPLHRPSILRRDDKDAYGVPYISIAALVALHAVYECVVDTRTASQTHPTA